MLDPDSEVDCEGELDALPLSLASPLGVGGPDGLGLVDGVTVTVTVGLALDGWVDVVLLGDVELDGPTGVGVAFFDWVPPNTLAPEP